MTQHRKLLAAPVILAALLLFAAARPAAAEGAGGGAQNARAMTCDKAQFRVVVDVGHTEEAHGAMSARRVPEYDFNLRLAEEIQHSLIEDGFSRSILLVTHGPKGPGLARRVDAANRAAANLFLSIHHDSVPDSFLEDWDFEGKPSHFSNRFSGHSLFVSYENPAHKASLLFASLLGRELKDRGLEYARHYTEEFMGRYRRELVDADAGVYRYDTLRVLKGTLMPAVLLEAGSIINRDEENLMDAPEHRALISAAVTKAIGLFCGVRAASG